MVAKSAAGDDAGESARARGRAGRGIVHRGAFGGGGSVGTSDDSAPCGKAGAADTLARRVRRTVHVELENGTRSSDADVAALVDPHPFGAGRGAGSGGFETDYGSVGRSGQPLRSVSRYCGHVGESASVVTGEKQSSDPFERRNGGRGTFRTVGPGNREVRVRGVIRLAHGSSDDLELGLRIRRTDSHETAGRRRHGRRSRADVRDVVDELVPHRGVEVGRSSGPRIRVVGRRERNVRRASYSGNRDDGNESRGPKGGAVHDGEGVFRSHGKMVTLRGWGNGREFYSGEMHAPSSGHHHVQVQSQPRFTPVFGTENSSDFER